MDHICEFSPCLRKTHKLETRSCEDSTLQPKIRYLRGIGGIDSKRAMFVNKAVERRATRTTIKPEHCGQGSSVGSFSFNLIYKFMCSKDLKQAKKEEKEKKFYFTLFHIDLTSLSSFFNNN